jgi:hypothetical protein
VPESPAWSTILARLRPGLEAQHPSIDPKEWFPVLASNPAAVDPYPREGYVWVRIAGRARQLPAAILTFDQPDLPPAWLQAALEPSRGVAP